MTAIRIDKDHIHARVGRTVVVHMTGDSASVQCAVPFFSTELLDDLWRLFNLDRFLGSSFVWLGCNSRPGIFQTGGHLQHMLDNPGERGLRSYSEKCTRLIKALLHHPMPTTAVISGGCFGGGLESALACHNLIAGPDALLQFPEFNFKSFPGMGGRLFAGELTEHCLDTLNEGGLVRGPFVLNRSMPRDLGLRLAAETPGSGSTYRHLVDEMLNDEREAWIERMGKLLADPIERRNLEVRARLQERMNRE